MDDGTCSCGDFFSIPCVQHAIRIEEWGLYVTDSKTGELRLHGRFPDGKVKYSRQIVQAGYGFAVDRKGMVFLLGTPSASYRKARDDMKQPIVATDPLRFAGTQ